MTGSGSTIDIRGKQVLIMKLRYIGDTLSILPVIDNLRRKAPDVKIDVMVNKGTEEVLSHHPGVRKVWAYDRSFATRNIINTVKYHITLIKRFRSVGYDVVMDFTHGDRAAFLSFTTGAPVRITYQKSSSLSHLLMNRVIDCDPFKHHIVDYQLEALRLFAMDDFQHEVKVHVPPEVQARADHLLEECGIEPSRFCVAIHPGARGPLRQWPVARFAEIAQRLKQRYFTPILLLGGAGDRALVESLEKSMGFPAPFKSSELTLLEMAAVLSRCSLFIGNDSAPAHIAASVGCPCLTLFGPTFPHLWRPLCPRGEVVFKNPPCCGCRQETCLRPDRNCMERIGVEEVWEKVEIMIPRTPPCI